MTHGDSDAPAASRTAASADQILLRCQGRTPTLTDFGGWTDLIALLPELVDHPLLIAVAHLMADPAMTEHSMQQATDAAGHLARAIVATKSPTIFRDTVDQVLASDQLLVATAGVLSAPLLAQSAQPSRGASRREALRAADALEVSVQLRLGNWAPRWDLFAVLAAYDGRGPAVYGRAVLRAVVAAIEQWTEAVDLLPAARRVAGLEAPLGTADPSQSASDPALSDSDTGLALSRISVLLALRSTDKAALLTHLDDAVRYLQPALEDDDRPDAHVTADIALLLRDLLVTGSIADADLPGRIKANVRELLHLDPGRSHWLGQRIAAAHAAWAKLAVQLSEAYEHLSEPSWYQAAAVIDDVVALYRTTGSTHIFRRTEDGAAIHDIVAPTLEAGFADQAGLMRHLQDHVRHLELLCNEGTATPDQIADLPVAVALRDAAAEQFRDPAGGYRPKSEAGMPPEGGGLSASQTATAFPRYSLEESGPDTPSQARVRQAVAVRISGARAFSRSLVVDELLDRAMTGLRASVDYVDDIAECVNLVTELLVMFLWDRNQIGASEAPYLYNPDADEDDLAKDLRQFLRASGQLNGVDSEVRHKAGGRVDVEFGFPGFSLFVELKKDATRKPVPDKKSYLDQAASYQVADPRIGFLLVLKLVPAEKAPKPHLLDCLEVVEVADANGAPRHVVALTLSGALTKPSDM
ncbi:hypothetical protein [Cryptosporangium phraense]|uniref:Uncharacterized protein n=1 Tax=Cryptosporangium phraense TaxID=2593070 RepID=A0A545AUX6_9ACTN|nr:hypothetical protein [Cryptosporangium phraense]TQS45140.1 hypothetical protein FL583_11645 [Cryptosporangium phraense]